MANSDFYVQDNSDIEFTKFEVAMNLYNRNDFVGALKIYLDMINTSYSYNLCYEIGRCYYKLMDMENAELYFTQSINLEDKKNPSYIFLGNIFSKKSNVQKAIEYWLEGYSYWPDDESLCLNLATSYFVKNMKFQSVYYYEKYLKYSKNQTSEYYNKIKNSIEKLQETSKDFYKKAKLAMEANDVNTAIEALIYANQNYPLDFDVNFLLGKIYHLQQNYEQAIIYLKQAYCLDRKSFDVLQLLSASFQAIGNNRSAYCCLKRIVQLVINNQSEYLSTIAALQKLEKSLVTTPYNIELAEKYYKENNYHFALFEYENMVILDGSCNEKYRNIIYKMKIFLNPEENVINECIKKGGFYYNSKDYKQANLYFSRVLSIATKNSYEYKLAKSRIMNV